jgi:hypothetical protein
MLTRRDPDNWLKNFEEGQGPILPPGGREGVVIIRRRKGTNVLFGFGRADGEFQLSRAQGRNNPTPAVRELTAEEYLELCGVISRQKFKQIGILEANTTDGEEYLIKYLEPAGMTVTYLPNPRKGALPVSVELADLIDALLEDRRWRATTNSNSSDHPAIAGKPSSRRQRGQRLLRFALALVAMASILAYPKRAAFQLKTTKPMPVPNKPQEIHLKPESKPPPAVTPPPEQ